MSAETVTQEQALLDGFRRLTDGGRQEVVKTIGKYAPPEADDEEPQDRQGCKPGNAALAKRIHEATPILDDDEDRRLINIFVSEDEGGASIGENFVSRYVYLTDSETMELCTALDRVLMQLLKG